MNNIFYPSQYGGIGSFFRGIFSSVWGKRGGKFTPSNSYRQLFGRQNNTILVDCSYGQLMQVAENVPHLNTIISTGGDLFSLMEIKHKRADGTEIEKSPVVKFLQQPNALQSLEEFLYNFYVQNAIYSRTFQYKLGSVSFDKLPAAIWLLPGGLMKINTTGKIYRQANIEDIIKNFEMEGDTTPFETKEVIYMSDGLGSDPLNPISKLASNQIPLSNIVASLKSHNIIITERGMIGFLKRKAPTGSDPQPADTNEIARMKKEYQEQYNLDSTSGHVGFTHEDMEWVPLTFNVEQLGLSGAIEDAFAALCMAYKHDRDLYPSVKGATYENKKEGLKNTINNAMQPLADKLMQQWTKQFIGEDSGEYLEACYDHLPCMKEDELKRAQEDKIEVETWQILFDNGIISAEAFAELAEVEFTGDGMKKQQATQIQLNNPKQPDPNEAS